MIDYNRIYKTIEEKTKKKNVTFLGFVDGEYKNRKSKVILKCNECGRIWDTTPYCGIVDLKCGCKPCQLKHFTEKLKNKIDDVMKRINTICSKNNWEFVEFENGSYETNESYLFIKCFNCGHIFRIRYKNLISGVGCKYCAKNIGKTEEELMNLIDKHCKEYDLIFCGLFDKQHNEIKKYKKLENLYISYKCKKCGYEWFSSYYSSIRSNSGCPSCSKCAKITEEQALKKIQEACILKNCTFNFFCDKNGEKCEWKNTHDSYLNLTCNKCGNTWNTTIYKSFVQKNNRCQHCNISQLERDVQTLLDNNELKYIYNDRRILKKLELDFYIPSKNIAIECQGMQHFEPVDFAGKGKKNAEKEFEKLLKRDETKRKLCEKLGIKLLYYSDLGIEYPYHVFENKEDLLEEIKKHNPL